MSRPLSVSSSTAYFGLSMSIWRISFRFFSPPEKPSFTERAVNFRAIRTHDGVDFPFLDREIQAAEDFCPRRGDAGVQVFDFEAHSFEKSLVSYASPIWPLPRRRISGTRRGRKLHGVKSTCAWETP